MRAVEAGDGFPRQTELAAGHAAAGVEQDAEANRRGFVREVQNIAVLAVLEDGEVVLTETGDKAAVATGHRRRYGDDVDARAECGRLLRAGGYPGNNRERDKGLSHGRHCIGDNALL